MLFDLFPSQNGTQGSIIMKLRSIITLFYFLSATALQAQTYTLVWSDEFNEPEINADNWTHEIGGHGWGNNESQYYTERSMNSFIQDSVLVIQALKENYGGKNYTSARMITRGKQFWQYGKIEARIKVPFSQGLWPAFWLLGESFGTVGWPACGEIDVMEFLGGTDQWGADRENRAYGTVHWQHDGRHASYGGHYTLNSGKFQDEFHVFTVEWTPTKMEWFIDGNSYHVIDITGAQLSELHDEFFILLNVAVGGNWPGYPDATSIFPQTMQVDYVRVYQYSGYNPVVQLSGPADGAQYEAGDVINLKAEAYFRGGIDKVEFYQGEVLIGETSLQPFEMSWRNVLPGCYTLRAKAIASNGLSARSKAIKILVGEDCARAPYQGYPAKIPGIVEAENFDLGGQNVGYSDSDAENSGAAYRNAEQVDIGWCEDLGGGYHVGWLASNEWLNYTVNIRETGSYNFEIRTASPESGGRFHIELDGEDVTGIINVPYTGGWDQWASTHVNSVKLSAGIHTLKLFIDADGFNVNKMKVVKPYSGPSIELESPNGGEILNAGTIHDIYWTSFGVDTVDIMLSLDGGISWEDIITKTSSEFDFYRWLIPDSYSDNCLLRVQYHTYAPVNDVSSSAFTITYPLNIADDPIEVRDFVLHQNYPNPFNPYTTISYELESRSKVEIAIFDMRGRRIRSFAGPVQNVGSYQVNWDGTDENNNPVNTGIYLCKLSTLEYSETIKMVYLK
jgi:beta-glucanase (GH16 family)